MENFLKLNPEVDIKIYYTYISKIYYILDYYFINDLNNIIFEYLNLHPLELIYNYPVDSILFDFRNILHNINYNYFNVILNNKYVSKKEYINFYLYITNIYFYKFESTIFELIGMLNTSYYEYYFYFFTDSESSSDSSTLILDSNLNRLLKYYN
jgi:hypothetical protein